MSDELAAGAAIGAMAGAAVAGLPGAVVGGVLGGLVGDAYSKKPSIGSFATTVQNDLRAENVTLDAHQIYVRITTGHGLDSLLAASDTAKQLSNSFAQRVSQIEAARGASAEAWLGDASAAASAATAPLSDSFAVAQEQLASNAQALNAEISAFTHIRSQVEPVPATPPQNDITNAVNPFQTDVDAAINEYNAKAAKNVQLYEAYSADTAAARSQVPQSYAGPALLSGSAAAITRTASPVRTTSATAPLQGASAAGQPAGTNANAATGSPRSAPPPTSSASSIPGDTPGQTATDPATRQPPATAAPITTTPGGLSATPTGRNTYATSRPRPTGTPDTQRKTTTAGPGIGAVSGFAGGAGAGMRGGGSSAGTGPVAGQPASGAGQPAGRSGAVGPAARGAAGLGGAPMGAAGRGNGEEDQEHQRKYLVEPDEELFGVDERCAPPVIGE